VTPAPLFLNPKTRHPENTGLHLLGTVCRASESGRCAPMLCVSAVPDSVPSALSSVFYLLGAYGAIWGSVPRVSAHKSRGTGWRSCTSRLPARGDRSAGFPAGTLIEWFMQSEKIAPPRKRAGITIADVLRTFPSAKVIQRSAEHQFELLEKAGKSRKVNDAENRK